jgi:hypothetical protein
MIAPAIASPSAAEPRAEYDYRFVANGALKSSIVLVAVKTLGAVWLNMQHGGTVSVARWHGIVPYLVFHLDPLHFTQVTTYSTIAATLVGTFLLLSKALRGSKDVRRSAAAMPTVIGTVWLVAVDLTLHFLRHGYIQPRPMLIAVALLFVQLGVAVVFITRHGEEVRAEALIQHDAEPVEEINELPATSPIAHLAPSSLLLPIAAPTNNSTTPTTHQTTGVLP